MSLVMLEYLEINFIAAAMLVAMLFIRISIIWGETGSGVISAGC